MEDLILRKKGLEESLLVQPQVTVSALVLDASSSMIEHAEIVQDQMHKHITTLQYESAKMPYFSCIIQFDRTAKVLLPLINVCDIDMKNFPRYVNGHGTRLYATNDEVLQQLLRLWKGLGPDQRQKLRIAYGTVSDGEDTLSGFGYPARLQQTAKQAIAAGFDFLTVGLGISAARLAQDMGFPANKEKAVTMNADAAGIENATQILTNHTTQALSLETLRELQRRQQG